MRAAHKALAFGQFCDAVDHCIVPCDTLDVSIAPISPFEIGCVERTVTAKFLWTACQQAALRSVTNRQQRIRGNPKWIYGPGPQGHMAIRVAPPVA